AVARGRSALDSFSPGNCVRRQGRETNARALAETPRATADGIRRRLADGRWSCDPCDPGGHGRNSGAGDQRQVVAASSTVSAGAQDARCRANRRAHHVRFAAARFEPDAGGTIQWRVTPGPTLTVPR